MCIVFELACYHKLLMAIRPVHEESGDGKKGRRGSGEAGGGGGGGDIDLGEQTFAHEIARNAEFSLCSTVHAQ